MLGAGAAESKGRRVVKRRREGHPGGPSWWPMPSSRQMTFLLAGSTTVMWKEPSEPHVAVAKRIPSQYTLNPTPHHVQRDHSGLKWPGPISPLGSPSPYANGSFHQSVSPRSCCQKERCPRLHSALARLGSQPYSSALCLCRSWRGQCDL